MHMRYKFSYIKMYCFCDKIKTLYSNYVYVFLKKEVKNKKVEFEREKWSTIHMNALERAKTMVYIQMKKAKS